MSIAQATRSTRTSKGSSFITRGADDHDHKAANNARRAMDKAVVTEQQEAVEVDTAKDVPTSFRLVIQTQTYENYATHCCDCVSDEACTCGEHWKAKGGSEYHQPLGSANDVIALGAKGIQAIADRMAKKATRNDRNWQENPTSWAIFSNTEETYPVTLER
jgi:hypothetical protein